jgi:RND family efflux transporter MFP subunit
MAQIFHFGLRIIALFRFYRSQPGGIVAQQSASQRKPLNPFANKAKSQPTTIKPKDASGAKNKLVGLLQIVGIVGVIALAVVVSRAPNTPATGTPAIVRPAATNQVTQVKVVQPIATTHQVSVNANGSISVRNYIDLTTQVSGRIETIAAALRVGGTFAAGETLLVLDQRDFKLRVAQAQADVASARSNLLLQQAKSDAAVANYALLNPGATAPPLVALTPQIAQAEAQLAAALARAEVAQLELSRTRFSLPFAGKVTESNAEIGQLLNSGKSFGRVFAIDAAELVLPIPADDLALIQPAQGRSVIFGDRGNSFSGRIERVSAELDARSRFAEVFIPVTLTADLQPGTFVDAQIQGPKLMDALQVPAAATQANGSLWYVSNDQLTRHNPVILGRNDQGPIIKRFDYGQGIVVGAVPGGTIGQEVSVLGNAS